MTTLTFPQDIYNFESIGIIYTCERNWILEGDFVDKKKLYVSPSVECAVNYFFFFFFLEGWRITERNRLKQFIIFRSDLRA